MYCVIVRDYQNKEEYVFNGFNTQENCMIYLEEYIEDFIYSKQGNDEKVTYFSQKPLQYEFKEGYYIYKKDFFQYVIIKRERNIGLLYNTFDDINIYIVSIGKIKNVNKKQNYNTDIIFKDVQSLNSSYFDNHEVKFNKCLSEINTDFIKSSKKILKQEEEKFNSVKISGEIDNEKIKIESEV